jgi:hypothetical protein
VVCCAAPTCPGARRHLHFRRRRRETHADRVNTRHSPPLFYLATHQRSSRAGPADSSGSTSFDERCGQETTEKWPKYVNISFSVPYYIKTWCAPRPPRKPPLLHLRPNSSKHVSPPRENRRDQGSSKSSERSQLPDAGCFFTNHPPDVYYGKQIKESALDNWCQTWPPRPVCRPPHTKRRSRRRRPPWSVALSTSVQIPELRQNLLMDSKFFQCETDRNQCDIASYPLCL